MNLAIIQAFRALRRDVLAFNGATSARNSASVILDATIDFPDVIANKTAGQKVGKQQLLLYKSILSVSLLCSSARMRSRHLHFLQILDANDGSAKRKLPKRLAAAGLQKTPSRRSI